MDLPQTENAWFKSNAWLLKGLIFILYAGIITVALLIILETTQKPQGDEIFYIQWAKDIGTNGLYSEMAKGHPVGYTALFYLLIQTGLKPIFAGDLISLISTIAVYIGARYIAKKYFELRGLFLELALVSMLFGLLSGNYIFVASDDMYYMALFIWIAIYLSEIVLSQGNNQKFALTGALLSLTLLIRPLALLLFTASIPALIFVPINKGPGRKVGGLLIFIVAFAIIFLLQQIPALHETGHIALENKMPDSVKTKITWTQKQVLTDILKENHIKVEENGQEASWRQCEEYLKIHGAASLPSNPLSRLFWSPWFVLKHAGIGVAKVVYILLRHTGILWMLPIIFLIFRRWRENKRIVFFTILVLGYLFLYLISALNFVETRHMIMPFIFLSMCGVNALFKLRQEENSYAGKLLILQLCTLLLIMALDLKLYLAAL